MTSAPTSTRTAALTPDRVARAAAVARPRRLGIVTELRGLHLVVKGVDGAVGDVVEVLGPVPVAAEVAAGGAEGLICLPMGPTTGLRTGMHVRSTGGPLRVPVGAELLGRVVDARVSGAMERVRAALLS